jgi:hypothetical protein
MKEKYKIPLRSILGAYIPPKENNHMSDEEIRIEIARLQKSSNKYRIGQLHKLIMFISGYYKTTKKHIMAPLTMQEWFEVFNSCDFILPELSDEGLKQLNEIHRTEPSEYKNDNLSVDEVKHEAEKLMKIISWKDNPSFDEIGQQIERMNAEQIGNNF